MGNGGYTISAAARAAGIGVETIRFYERKGLIEQPPRPARGARRYPRATVDRIRALRQGQALGFSLAEVGGLLALRTDPAADCSAVRQRARDHLEEIERKQARLGEVADELRALIAACPGRGATHECAILDAFVGDPGPARGDGTARRSGTARVELRVRELACGSCAGAVHAILRDVPGVRDAAVDRVAGIVRVDIDPALADTASLAAKLTHAGFPATPR